MARAPLAADRRDGCKLGHRTGLRPRDCLPDTGGHQTIFGSGEGRTRGSGEAGKRGSWSRRSATGAQMKERRVVITGIGAITPIGTGVEGLWEGLRRRESAVRCITRFDPSMFKSRIAGEVAEFAATDHMEERRARRLDRFSQFTVAATRMALGDAHLV